MATATLTPLDRAYEAGGRLIDLEVKVGRLLDRRRDLLLEVRAGGIKTPRIREVTGLARQTIFDDAPRAAYSQVTPPANPEVVLHELAGVCEEIRRLREPRPRHEETRDRAIVDAFDAKMFKLRANPDGAVSIEEFAGRAGCSSQRVYQILEAAGRKPRDP